MVKIGDKIEILPHAKGTASRYIGKVLTVTEEGTRAIYAETENGDNMGLYTGIDSDEKCEFKKVDVIIENFPIY